MRLGKRWWVVDLPTWLLLANEMAFTEQVREGEMMPVDPELLELFVDDVWIEPWVSEDFDNVVTYGTAVKYRAKIDEKYEELTRKSGDVVVSTHRVALDDVYPGITEKDRIAMPTRSRVQNPTIVGFLGWTDENPITSTNLGHHTTLRVGPRKGANA